MAQSDLNIGTIGHVDHGKTSLTAAITGKFTDTHSQEIKRGITIKLGYADFAVYKCPSCPAPQSYSTQPTCPKCGAVGKFERRISLLDAPGHETLMATVIAASSILDGAIFVIAANEKCPQPQTVEHLMVMEAAGIQHVVVAQNKVDLVTRERALESQKEIREFLQGSPYEKAPIIPTSANVKANIDALLMAIEKTIPTPSRKEGVPLFMVARSFDVNKPGARVDKLVGGVLGGSLVRGELKVGDDVTLLPGILHSRKGKDSYELVTTKIVGLSAGNESVQVAKPGGLVGISTQLDPAVTHADSLAGSLAGPKDALPPVREEIKVDLQEFRRKIEKFPPSFVINEPLVLGVGTATTVGFVQSAQGQKRLQLKLKKPVAAETGATVAVMRRAGGRWHLFGAAKLLA